MAEKLILSLSVTLFKRPLRKTLTIPGKDGSDVPLYLEKELTQLLIEIKKIQEDDNL